MKNDTESSLNVHVTPLLRHLMQNADQNTGKLDKQRRHSIVLKKFATYYISFLVRWHMSSFKRICRGFAFVRTVQSIVHHQYSKVEEAFLDLMSWLCI